MPVSLAIGARTLGEGRVALALVPPSGAALAIDATLARGPELALAKDALSLAATALGRALGRDVRAILVAL